MKRGVTSVAFGITFGCAAFSATTDAKAQTYECDYAGECLLGVDTASNSGYAIGGQDTHGGYGVAGQSFSGVGISGMVSTNGSPLQVCSSSAGVCGAADSTASSGTPGGQFSSAVGVGLIGLHSGGSASIPSGATYGVWGSSSNSDGVHGAVNSAAAGVAGVNSGSGVGMEGNNIAASGGGYGVYGTSASNDGVHGTVSTGAAGVAGLNTGSGAGTSGNNTGTGYGVEGTCSGSGCASIYGACTGSACTSVSGHGGYIAGNFYTTVANSYGVFGESDGTNGYGVFGTCTASPCYAGYFAGTTNVQGCFQVNGTNEFGCTSDRRLKKNIAPLTGALDALLKLKGVTYDWRNPEQQGKHAGEKQTGFIAQDVEDVFPQWVGEDKNGYKTLMVQPNHITALEVESIRTLKMQNDMLAERVKELESGRQPRVAGFNLDGVGFGVGGLAIAGAIVFASRKKREEKPAQL